MNFLTDTKGHKWALVPLNPSLAMLEEGWGICGTELSSMQPNPVKIEEATVKYKKLLEASAHCLDLNLESLIK